MASFVDLMGNDVWSEADIKARLHAEIRSQISEFAEMELNRALQGKIMGLYVLTAQDQASLMIFKGATDRVTALGTAARADAALLKQVRALEAARRRLAQTVQPGSDDAAQRLAAQATVTAADAATVALALLRVPVVQAAPAVQPSVTGLVGLGVVK